MADESRTTEAILDAHIAYLEDHANEVARAISSLRAIRESSKGLDSKFAEVMANAILREVSPSVRGWTTAGSTLLYPPLPGPIQHITTMTTPVKSAEDDDFAPDPNAPVPEPEEAITNFGKIRMVLLKHNNQQMSAATLKHLSGLSRGAVSTVLYTTHHGYFEKLKIGKLNRWRLKPEMLERHREWAGMNRTAGPDESGKKEMEAKE